MPAAGFDQCDGPAPQTAEHDEARSQANATSAGELRKRAFRLLARRDRSRIELQRLLALHCSDPTAVTSLLGDLENRGWLSESRLADQLVASRRARTSAMRLRQEMARRGLGAEAIAQATAGLDRTDLPTAMALWQKRFGTPPVDRSQRERQLRFLLARGFSQTIALKVLRAAGANGLEDEGQDHGHG